MPTHQKLIEEQEKILRTLSLNLQTLRDKIKYHEDQLNWLKEQSNMT